MHVRITRIHPDAILPEYKTSGSVAFDLATIETAVIPPKQLIFVKTGLVIAAPPGYAFLIAPRSSLFKKKGLRLGNTIGIVDQDFCGPEDEILLALWNPRDQDVSVEKGERLAQGLFVKIDRAEWIEGAADTPSRGGWGSTGSF